jgi:hypothetical protein
VHQVQPLTLEVILTYIIIQEKKISFIVIWESMMI